MRQLLSLIAVASLLFLAGASAQGETITYTYSTMLTAEGADTAGLSGATVTVNAMFSSTDTYVPLIGPPAVVADLGATYTITGASDSLNDGTFAMPEMAFFANYTGLLTVDSGGIPVVTLGNGVSLGMCLETDPTSHGAGVLPGDTINILDFAPAISKDLQWATDDTLYDQSHITLSVSEPSAVPEPSSLALCALAGAIGSAYAWRHRKQAATA
jgi:hypothetical protein